MIVSKLKDIYEKCFITLSGYSDPLPVSGDRLYSLIWNMLSKEERPLVVEVLDYDQTIKIGEEKFPMANFDNSKIYARFQSNKIENISKTLNYNVVKMESVCQEFYYIYSYISANPYEISYDEVDTLQTLNELYKKIKEEERVSGLNRLGTHVLSTACCHLYYSLSSFMINHYRSYNKFFYDMKGEFKYLDLIFADEKYLIAKFIVENNIFFVESSFQSMNPFSGYNTYGRIKVRRDERGRLHSKNGEPSVEGFKGNEYHWHGVRIDPAIFYHTSTFLDKFSKIRNMEQRRAYYEITKSILSQEEFFQCFPIYEYKWRWDKYGNKQVLYKSTEVDPVTGFHQNYIQVVCPSTKREYFICIPPEITKIKEAVAWTFGKNSSTYAPKIET